MAFRFGHSLLSADLQRQGNNGLPVAAEVPLAEDFFDPDIFNGRGRPTTTDPVTGLPTTNIGAVLKGDADGDAQAEDVQVVNEVRNLLFNEVVPGVGFGQDLIALDIERGRDNGIGSYNQVRVALGLPAVTSFAQITSNVQVQQELQEAYGNVNNIDAFEGGLAENLVPGSTVGPLFQTIMVDQFTNLRDGDRFFYLNEHFSPSEEAILRQGDTLAKVIEANTGITNLPSDVFIFKASISGTVSLAPRVARRSCNGVAGITVQLEDTSGDILATTTTNSRGQYTFNQHSGPAANPVNSPRGQRDGILSRGFGSARFVAPGLAEPAFNPDQPRRNQRERGELRSRKRGARAIVTPPSTCIVSKRGVPDADRAICTSRCEASAIGTPRDGPDGAAVTSQHEGLLAGGRVPQGHGGVLCRGGEASAVRAVANAPRGAMSTEKRRPFVAGGEAPAVYRAVAAGRS